MFKNFKMASSFLLNLLFPMECLGCGKEDIWVCRECFQKLPLDLQEICPACREYSLNGELCLGCRRTRFYLDGLTAASFYDHFLVKTIIINLKFNYLEELSEVLAQLMWRALRFRGIFLEENWFLSPVPLHPKRQRERGFNQAELLCRHLSRLSGLPWQTVLSRKSWTPPQAKLRAADRRENLKNVFACQKNKVKGKKILLVDDVFTTGTTLNESAKVLKAAGAKEVWGLVAARGSGGVVKDN